MQINPVHYYAPTMGDADGPEAGWYFWYETWHDRQGPFDTELEATEALLRYCESLE